MTTENKYQPVEFSKLTKHQQSLFGKRIGDLIVVGVAGRRRRTDRVGIYWNCRCLSCDRFFIRPMETLFRGTSCGCVWKQNVLKSLKKHFVGYTVNGKLTSEGKAYNAAIERCENPNTKHWSRYGGRGIKFHPEWRRDFTKFINYIGFKPTPKHTLDRIDNDGDYEPGNVQWATRREQSNNRRCSIRYTVDGLSLTKAEWSRHLNVPDHHFDKKYLKGMTVEQMVRLKMGLV